MDNPLTFLLVVIGIFFTLWLVGGGPTRAISFSGPYITPITNVGESQAGYGEQLNPTAYLTLPGGGSASVSEKSSASAKSTASSARAVAPKTSTYEGLVTIARTTAANSQNPGQKYVELILASHSSQSLTLSDWELVSMANDSTVLIKNGTSSSVTLGADQSAVIVTTFPASTAHDTIRLLDGTGAVVSTVQY